MVLRALTCSQHINTPYRISFMIRTSIALKGAAAALAGVLLPRPFAFYPRAEG